MQTPNHPAQSGLRYHPWENVLLCHARVTEPIFSVNPKMSEAQNPRRPRRGTWKPRPETLALLRVSGNPINGVGETSPRRPSPFFWHPPDRHPWGPLQIVARQNSRKCPGSTEAFQAAYSYPELKPVVAARNESPAQDLTEAVKNFALSHEADDVGIASMDPLYVFEGYTITHPWVIVLALAHNYERLREVPSDENNGVGVCDVGDQYARGTRSSYALANWIRSPGVQCRSLSRAERRRAPAHSSGDCRRTRRAGQARIADQPALRFRRSSRGRHDRHASGSNSGPAFRRR